MDSLDSMLAAMRADLERLGYTVVPHGDCICIRLPLASSVRVYRTDAGFRFRPKFGPFGRTAGAMFTSGVTGGGVILAALTGVSVPVTIGVAFLGVMALIHDGCRFVVTEGCLNRLQALITFRGGLGAASVTGGGPRDALAAGRLPSPGAVHPGAPRQRAAEPGTVPSPRAE